MNGHRNTFDDPPKYLIAGSPVYPHLKLTTEEFPRVLATRVLRDDGDEYFGAFLTKTAVRILIDFLNRTFRLRSCDIEIDGSFPVPCTQYFAKRCVAPCVAEICSREMYREIADAVRLFLRNERDGLRAVMLRKIEAAAEGLDYEKAAFWRDVLQSCEGFWSRTRWQVWLDDAVDTYEADVDGDRIDVFLVTQRGRRILGTHTFSFERRVGGSAGEAVADVVKQFYVYHAPREIRVPEDFAGRKRAASRLSRRFGRQVQIKVAGERGRTAAAAGAIERSRAATVLKRMSVRGGTTEIQSELREQFGLETVPKWIEVFDVAHISGSGFAGGMAVWKNGQTRPENLRHWILDHGSELDAVRSVIEQRFGDASEAEPDMILIDGGRSHLNAALSALKPVADRRFAVVSVVKPRGKHSAVSHFLTEDGRRIEFDPASAAHRLLQTLRDEAHELSNSVHRVYRDMLHHYERRGLEPLIVPIRFHEKGGEADDLRPIVTR